MLKINFHEYVTLQVQSENIIWKIYENIEKLISEVKKKILESNTPFFFNIARWQEKDQSKKRKSYKLQVLSEVLLENVMCAQTSRIYSR